MKYSRKRLRGKIHSKNYRIDKRRLYFECKKKTAYETSGAANRMIRHQYMKYGIKLNYYQCSFCGKFHLSKQYVGEKFKS